MHCVNTVTGGSRQKRKSSASLCVLDITCGVTMPRVAVPSVEPSVTSTQTYDMRNTREPIRHPPVVHIARGYECHLPFLHAGRAVICISDWQVEPATQRHFWEQVMTTLVDELGMQAVSRALVLVAGDMASCSNALRGTQSDACPDISWLRDSVSDGDVLCVYGNHDLVADEQFTWRNPASGLPCLLPHGAALRVGMTSAAPPAPPTPPAAPAAAPIAHARLPDASSTAMGTSDARPTDMDATESRAEVREGEEAQAAEACAVAAAPAAVAAAPAAVAAAPPAVAAAPPAVAAAPAALAAASAAVVAAPPAVAAASASAAAAGAASARGEASEGPWGVPTAEELAGLTKQQRAALWAASRVQERKRVLPTKGERQQRQHAAQFPEEACAAARLRALHADGPHLVLPPQADASACKRPPRRLPLEAEASASAGGAAQEAAKRHAERPLLVGAVHGIPASHTQGLRKIERDDYFRAVRAACAVPGLDVLVTHSNPRLAGQVEVRGEDAPRLHEAFLHSTASLHVHGHMHTEPAVSIVAPGKVVVNADCRVVAFVPPDLVSSGQTADRSR